MSIKLDTEEIKTANKIFYIKVLPVFSVKCFKFKMICLPLTRQNGFGGCILDILARLVRVLRYCLLFWSSAPMVHSHCSLSDTLMC